MATSRPEVVAFLQAIKEQPEDDTPRLILADWLEERSDPRGELLRLQVTLARLIPGTKAWWTRHDQELRLRKLHEKDWLGPLADLADSYTLQRGLVQLTLTVEDFLGDRVVELAETETFAWVDGVRLTQGVGLPWSRQMPRLVESPLLAGLNGLNLGNEGIDGFGASLLADCPHLANLTVLELYGNRIGESGVPALAASPYLAKLTTLDLDGCLTGDEEVWALAGSPHWDRLTTLQLRSNRIGDAGVEALARMPRLPSLTALHLSGNRIGDAGAQALIDSPRLKTLEVLDLQRNPISGPAAETLRQRFGMRVTV
jgi:uncharacterized protein (TIGR02996 family)